jgi:hypothetical protein
VVFPSSFRAPREVTCESSSHGGGSDEGYEDDMSKHTLHSVDCVHYLECVVDFKDGICVD